MPLEPQKQLVSLRIIMVRLGDLHPVFGPVGQRNTVIVRLHFPVGRSVGFDRFRADSVQQSAGRIALDHIRVYSVGKLMSVHQLNSIVSLAVTPVVLPTDGIADSCPGHQVALVTAIDIYLCAHFAPESPARRNGILQPDATDHPVRNGGAQDPALVPNLDSRSLDILVENRLCRLRFENPLLELAVMPAQTTIEIEGKAPDHIFVSYIGIAEPAGTHASQMPPRLDQQYAFAGLPGRVRGNNPGRRSPVYAYVHRLRYLSFQTQRLEQDHRRRQPAEQQNSDPSHAVFSFDLSVKRRLFLRTATIQSWQKNGTWQ